MLLSLLSTYRQADQSRRRGRRDQDHADNECGVLVLEPERVRPTTRPAATTAIGLPFTCLGSA
jgi:hypothetical protein